MTPPTNPIPFGLTVTKENAKEIEREICMQARLDPDKYEFSYFIRAIINERKQS